MDSHFYIKTASQNFNHREAKISLIAIVSRNKLHYKNLAITIKYIWGNSWKNRKLLHKLPLAETLLATALHRR